MQLGDASGLLDPLEHLLNHVVQDGRARSSGRCRFRRLRDARGIYRRTLKLARTIADLAGSEEMQSAHLAEALQYRPKLMME